MKRSIWTNGLARFFGKMTKTASRAGSKAIVKAIKNAPATPGRSAGPGAASSPNWTSGFAMGTAGGRRYRLYRPAGVRHNERLPLIVMLHGCGQNADTFAQCTKMNRRAANERFFVLYPEQERISNAQNCWNWFDTRSGRAQREADSVDAAIRHVCLLHPVDPERIVLAGLSAGASMAALMAARHPSRYRAIVMHSGVPPGLAHSSTGAMAAMQGRKPPLAPLPAGVQPPALLAIHGSNDRIVFPINALHAAQLWARSWHAKPGVPRIVRRGARHPMTITDYRAEGRVVATLCQVHELAHAWSGGAAGRAYSDVKGPDASSMIWSFAKKQFALHR